MIRQAILFLMLICVAPFMWAANENVKINGTVVDEHN